MARDLAGAADPWEGSLRGWRRAQVEAFLAEAGFTVAEVLGSLAGDPWTPTASDLVVVARRA